MFSWHRAYSISLVLVLLPALAFAETEPKIQRVTFKDGRATIKGSIKGYETIDYVFPAGSGESLQVGLKTNKTSNYFNLTAPGAQEALFIGSTFGSNFNGVAPVSGDYTARVYLMRNSARRGSVANYTLTIALGEKSGTDPKRPDYADGLTGGPDYWEVTGVASGDDLKMRKTPSPKGKLVMGFANGTLLKNLGCKNTHGQKWCEVQRPDDTAMRGWVNGRYLRESGGPR